MGRIGLMGLVGRKAAVAAPLAKSAVPSKKLARFWAGFLVFMELS
jgi:hypothetical protein